MFKHCLRMLRNASLLVAVCSAALHAEPRAHAPEIEKLEQQCLDAKTQEQCRGAIPLCAQADEARQKQPRSRERDLQRASLWHQRATCELLLRQNAEAAGHAQQAVTVRQKLLGVDHLDVADGINTLAGALSSQSKFSQAEGLLRQALSIRQNLLGSENKKVADNLNDLADVLFQQGKYPQCEDLYRQSLSMQQKLLGAEHVDVATVLANTASVLSVRGNYTEAENFLRQSLAMRKKLLGAEHPDVAHSLGNLGTVLLKQGQYAQAEALYRQAITMLQKRVGGEHEEIAQNLHGVAIAVARQGQYAQAEALYRQALSMRQKLQGTEHPEVNRILSNLALLLSKQGKYAQAESLVRQALLTRQKLLGAEHPDVSFSLNDLALVLSNQGKYAQAEDLYRQVLSTRQKLLGAKHPDVAVSLHNLASVLSSQGRYARAEELYRQALAMRQELLGAEHPSVADSLNGLAVVLSKQAKYAQAEAFYHQALVMDQRRFGAEHPNVADSLHNLASVFESQGKYEQAEDTYRQALSMRQKLLGTEHPNIAANFHNLASTLLKQGKCVQAEDLERQALGMGQKLLGANHPHLATSLHNLASVLACQKRFGPALPFFIKSAQIREEMLRATSSETRMRAVLDQVRSEEDAVYGLLLDYPNDVGLQQLTLTTTLLRKGRAAEAGMLANRVLHRSPSNGGRKTLFEEWQMVRQQREALLFGSSSKLSREVYRSRLTELAHSAEDLESQLAAQMPELRALQPPAFDEILPQVAAHLPAGGVLIEVVWVAPQNFQAKGTEPRSTLPHYIAMVLTADKRIAVKDLGRADAIDRHVQELRAALRSPVQDPKGPAQAVYEEVLRPLVPGSAEDIYLSLDGALNLIPFDALHDGVDYLLGRKSFHYLTSGRDLLRRDSAQSGHVALVLADPDLRKVNGTPDDTSTYYDRLSGLRALPSARHEAAVIGPLLSVAPLLGKAATESVVRSAHSPWVLHIASHGLFLEGKDLPHQLARGALLSADTSRDRSALLLNAVQSKRMHRAGDFDSLSQSALVLAGAAAGKTATSTAEDGVLTAEEARSLDLSSTQLVVLSACDTGQGDLSAGQGVYGLRRAFLVAGAETLVTSLWQVNDAATGNLMELYYQKLIRGKQGRLAAMQATMKEMRAKYDHPYYWAPFLVIGSANPLRIPQTKAH